MRFCREHAAITDQDDALEVKALAQFVHLRSHGLWIARVAFEDFNGDGQPSGSERSPKTICGLARRSSRE
ncbi:MAG: hypothetical protein LC130_20750 [Bryobacterales bacterium]|nr:hypothetical protein [Bryobacterales bacterium]